MSRSALFKLLLVAGLVAFSACAQESGDNPFVVGGRVVLPGDEDQPKTPDDLHDVVTSSVADVETFWEEAYPEVYGSRFEPVAGYYSYGPDTDMPPCGSPPPTYQDIADNAFYCPESDIIAADEGVLIPRLAREYGPFTIGIVFAHEYGHAIQARANEFSDFSVVTEMQADCFAGAWTAWVSAGNSDSFDVAEDQLDLSLAGILSISDVPGTDAADLAAHGSGFDRIGSFQDGFENGASRCSEYDNVDLPIVEMTFDENDLTGGNMPTNDLLPDLKEDLDLFYSSLFDKLGQEWEPVNELVVVDPQSDEAECGGQTLSGSDLEYASYFCADENTVLVDGANLIPYLEEIGDFAVATEVARLYAVDAQLQLGIEDRDKDASLQSDCLVGVWAAASFPDRSTGQTQLGEAANLVLSAGDLDEAIQGFLIDRGEDSSDVGTAFDRVRALRGGFIEGYEACDLPS
jgi:predicted metalloprotease